MKKTLIAAVLVMCTAIAFCQELNRPDPLFTMGEQVEDMPYGEMDFFTVLSDNSYYYAIVNGDDQYGRNLKYQIVKFDQNMNKVVRNDFENKFPDGGKIIKAWLGDTQIHMITEYKGKNQYSVYHTAFDKATILEGKTTNLFDSKYTRSDITHVSVTQSDNKRYVSVVSYVGNKANQLYDASIQMYDKNMEKQWETVYQIPNVDNSKIVDDGTLYTMGYPAKGKKGGDIYISVIKDNLVQKHTFAIQNLAYSAAPKMISIKKGVVVAVGTISSGKNNTISGLYSFAFNTRDNTFIEEVDVKELEMIDINMACNHDGDNPNNQNQIDYMDPIGTISYPNGGGYAGFNRFFMVKEFEGMRRVSSGIVACRVNEWGQITYLTVVRKSVRTPEDDIKAGTLMFLHKGEWGDDLCFVFSDNAKNAYKNDETKPNKDLFINPGAKKGDIISMATIDVYGNVSKQLVDKKNHKFLMPSMVKVNANSVLTGVYSNCAVGLGMIEF